MDDNNTPQAPKRASNLYRNSFAFHMEHKEGLTRVLQGCGVNTVSELLALLAQAPEAASAAIKPVIDQVRESKAKRVTKSSVVRQLREGEIDPGELARALELVRQGRSA